MRGCSNTLYIQVLIDQHQLLIREVPPRRTKVRGLYEVIEKCQKIFVIYHLIASSIAYIDKQTIICSR